jgi:large subunit ribosomal protein L24
MGTIQPRKQHKMLYHAPKHIRYRLFSAPLSPSLKTTHKVNSVPVRSGDTVRIMRGDRKGAEGKVAKVDRGKYRLFVEGVTREKVDGTAIQVPIHPSKVMITGLNLDDKWRRESLKVEAPKEAAKPEEKPAEEPKKERKKRKPRKASSRKTKSTEKKEGGEQSG